MHHKLILFTMLLVIVHGAHALTMNQIMELQSVVIAICRGGSMVGSSTKMTISGTASGKVVVIKGFMQGGGDARIDLTNEDWKGIKALSNSEGYTQCVDSTLERFTKALEQ